MSVNKVTAFLFVVFGLVVSIQTGTDTTALEHPNKHGHQEVNVSSASAAKIERDAPHAPKSRESNAVSELPNQGQQQHAKHKSPKTLESKRLRDQTQDAKNGATKFRNNLMLVLASGALAAVDAQPALQLMQMKSIVHLGKSAPLTEAGYQEVARLNSDSEMMKYIMRVVEAKKYTVNDWSEFEGLVPWYSGTKDTQSYDKLLTDLKDKSWVLRSSDQDDDVASRSSAPEEKTAGGDALSDFMSKYGSKGHVSLVDVKTSGKTAPLTEAGYKQVAALRSDDQMKRYVLRILRAEKRKVTNWGAFNGFVHWYSGTKAVQDLSRLRKELLSAAWIAKAPARQSSLSLLQMDVEGQAPSSSQDLDINGQTAPLTESGYQQVAAMHSDKEMKRYILRALDAHGKTVNDWEKFAQMVPMYSGTKSVQNMLRLQRAIRHKPWLVNQKDPQITMPLLPAMLVDVTSDSSSQARSVKQWLDDQEVSASGKSSALAQSQDQSQSDVPTAAAPKLIKGATAPLTEQGYQQVAALRRDEDMRDFLLRVVAADGKTVINWGEFEGLVPWYSGTKAVQNFLALQVDLNRKTWLVDTPSLQNGMLSGTGKAMPSLLATQSSTQTGATSMQGKLDAATIPLTEAGYQQLATLRSDDAMKQYMLRVLDADAKTVMDWGKFEGLVPWYSGTKAVQSFLAMQVEFSKKSWLTDMTYSHAAVSLVQISAEKVERQHVDKPAPLTPAGPKELLELGSGAGMKRYVSEEHRRSSKPHPRQQNVLALLGVNASGRTAPFTEEGYQQVAAMRNNDEMKEYILRLVDAEGKMLANWGDLNGFVPWYSGADAVQTFLKLREDLIKQPWLVDAPAIETTSSLLQLTADGHAPELPRHAPELRRHALELPESPHINGTTAPLTESGYKQLAELRSVDEMAIYILRLVDASKKKVADWDEFSKFVQEYSGAKSVQSLQRLQVDISHMPWLVSEKEPQLTVPMLPVLVDTTNSTSGQRPIRKEDQPDAPDANAHVKVVERTAFVPGKVDQQVIVADNAASQARAATQDQPAAQASSPTQELNSPSDVALTQARGSTAPLTDKGSQQVSAADQTAAQEPSQTRDQPIAQSSSQTQDQSNVPSDGALTRMSGATAPLTENGYQQVVALHNDEEMGDFVLRFLAGYGKTVSNFGKFYSLLPWYSGTQAAQSLLALQADLNSKPWVVGMPAERLRAALISIESKASTAPLTEAGYQQVAALKSDAAMKQYMLRVLDADGKTIGDWGMFEGLVPYYSGTKLTQSLWAMQVEFAQMPANKDSMSLVQFGTKVLQRGHGPEHESLNHADMKEYERPDAHGLGNRNTDGGQVEAVEREADKNDAKDGSSHGSGRPGLALMQEGQEKMQTEASNLPGPEVVNKNRAKTEYVASVAARLMFIFAAVAFVSVHASQADDCAENHGGKRAASRTAEAAVSATPQKITSAD